jgi:hypothetical protein
MNKPANNNSSEQQVVSSEQPSRKPGYSIRFSFTREKTGLRRGPRFHRVVNSAGLDGARFCAAKMLNGAIRYREASARHRENDLVARINRLSMRLDALWARVFAGQIDQHDARLDAVSNERSALMNQCCNRADA